MDRASGSGVFARDPDALLDLTELDVTDDVFIQQENKEIINIIKERLITWKHNLEMCSQDDLQNANAMLEIARKELPENAFKTMTTEYIPNAKKAVRRRTAWRIEGTLREFPKLAPINLWFDYPVHYSDDAGVLKDCDYDGERNSRNSPYRKNFGKKKSNEQKKAERKENIEEIFNACNLDGNVTVSDLIEYSGKTEVTIRKHLKEHGGFVVKGGFVTLKDE